MRVEITPLPLTGTLCAIPSKSAAHRLLICAAFADRPTMLTLTDTSADIDATIDCLRTLGAKIELSGDTVSVTPIVPVEGVPTLDCRESGSTLRFMLPVACALYPEVNFTGCGRLPQRPVNELTAVMKEHGVSFSSETLPFTTYGTLTGGEFSLPGNVSSQYITGLLLALPITGAGGTVKLTTELKSRPYVDITLSAMSAFGISVSSDEQSFTVPVNAKYTSPGEYHVEGDWSNAAFYLTAGALSSPVTMTGLDLDSFQGDKKILDFLTRFGAEVTVSENCVTVSPAPLHGCEIDIDDTPDLLPVLAVAAACADGETRFTNASRLRIKESDRLMTVASMITSLGGDVEELEDGLIIKGKNQLSGGETDSFNDHRIAMAAAIAALRCSGKVTITGAEAVNKSYPAFYEHYNSLGGSANVI